MDEIDIWSETDINSSVTHFCFQRDGYRRICDNHLLEDAESIEREQPVSPIPCRMCKSLYLEDVLYGKQVLRISADPPLLKRGVVAPYNDMHPLYYGVSASLLGVSMPKIPMSSFAKFYEVRPAEQVRIVRDIRTRLLDPERYMARDYYGPLRNLLRKTHWATGEIEDFEGALDPFLESQRFNDRKDHYERLGKAYVAYWRNVDGAHFAIPPIDVTISDLTIAVRPELGLQTEGGDYQALKVWFNSDRPSRQARQIMVYLMDRANEQSEKWSSRWYSGIWDIRRQNVLPPMQPARDLELGLTGQIAAFLHIWNELDRQSREGYLLC